ncbi:MAG: SDR family NAD(P)-dependent oxidoreductase [Pirellulaceae bacterium]|nr:SDR family NAD(P)-dependent oxidoreductase [Pirellulaceae bacterium]
MSTTRPKKTAVITGAGGGLGSCFSKRLAAEQYDLLLVDHPSQSLDDSVKQLRDEFGVDVESVSADLTLHEDVAELADHLAARDDIELLVNNAGFGHTQYFVDMDANDHLNMIRVHVMATVHLSRAVLPQMIDRDAGAIVNVSSLCAWTPCAGVVQYSATKSYLVSLSKAIQDELRDTQVRVQALCPGFVKTGFFTKERMQSFDRTRVPRILWVTPDDVVDFSIKRLASRKVVAVPGGVLCRILGRLMQIPIVQPIVQRFARQAKKAPVESARVAKEENHCSSTERSSTERSTERSSTECSSTE